MGEEQTIDLSFLAERGLDANRPFTEDERQHLARAQAALYGAESVVVRIGGQAGRLGESIVATALLEGVLQALRYAGKAGIPIAIIVDEGVGELFEAGAYQQAYWPEISVRTAPITQLVDADDLRASAVSITPARPALLLDLHGAHDGMPRLQEYDAAPALLHLMRVGIRHYSRHGPLRRYAGFIEDLFTLPRDSLDGELVQPAIRLLPEDHARYLALAQTFGLHDSAIRIICFFQSVVIAKCYGRWDEVVRRLADEVAGRWPGRRLEFLVACGPDEQQPEGLRRADLAAEYADFRAGWDNARVSVQYTPSLRDLAVLLSHAHLALANDTGPGHLAGALGVHTIVPFLPGGVYAQEVWSSTLYHHGVTLEPNPFTRREIESAVINDRTDIINSIEPAQLVDTAMKCLSERAPE